MFKFIIELINKLKIKKPKEDHPCKKECQYAKDIGMIAYSCVYCMYEEHNRF